MGEGLDGNSLHIPARRCLHTLRKESEKCCEINFANFSPGWAPARICLQWTIAMWDKAEQVACMCDPTQQGRQLQGCSCGCLGQASRGPDREGIHGPSSPALSARWLLLVITMNEFLLVL